MATILIVEDNSFNMELTTDLLGAGGFSVIQATTAEEGVQAATSLQPDLILMDIALPGMDGLAATELLKCDTRTRAIPIVAVTAHAMCGDSEKALAIGCVGYITKPINTREFAGAVAGFLLASASC